MSTAPINDELGVHPDLHIVRYGVRAYGCFEHGSGPYLRAKDVIKAIEAMLDDDARTITLLLDYLDTLKKSEPR
jgi:hypothetical protein